MDKFEAKAKEVVQSWLRTLDVDMVVKVMYEYSLEQAIAAALREAAEEACDSRVSIARLRLREAEDESARLNAQLDYAKKMIRACHVYPSGADIIIADIEAIGSLTATGTADNGKVRATT
jgi:hypothetical protein